MSNKKTSAAQHLVLFDGVCNLCNRTVQFIIKNDPDAKFTFAALQQYSKHTKFQSDQIMNIQTESVVYIKNGQVFYASSAVLEILKELGWPWKVLYVLKIFPIRFRDFLYNQIARRRYRVFGKRTHCMVPSAEDRDRFLL